MKRVMKGTVIIMTVLVNGIAIGDIICGTISIEQAMYALGYDVKDDEDCKRGYDDGIECFYLDDDGHYCFDSETVEMVY